MIRKKLKKMRRKYWLLDYFIIPHNRLAPSYVKKVEKFCRSIHGSSRLMFKTVTWNTGAAAMRARHNLKLKKNKKKMKATSVKHQATSALKKPQFNCIG